MLAAPLRGNEVLRYGGRELVALEFPFLPLRQPFHYLIPLSLFCFQIIGPKNEATRCVWHIEDGHTVIII